MSCNNCKNVEKCQDYIDERGKVEIATAGYNLVKNRHTYKHRAKQILEMI